LLSEGLASTSVAGNPREWFNEAEEQHRRAQWCVEQSTAPVYSTYLARVLEQGTTPNGIFGIKLHYYQFTELSVKFGTIEKYKGMERSQLLSALFPNLKYIWLTRRDKIRQAISYLRACQTNQWWLIEGVAPGKRKECVDKLSFDPLAIARLEKILAQNDCRWQHYFESNQLCPLKIYYEDLVADYSGTIISVLKWLNVPDAESVCVGRTRLKQQSDSLTEDWLAAYRKLKENGKHPEKTASPTDAEATGTGEYSPLSEGLEDDHSVALSSPLFVRALKLRETISDPWKRWIGESKLRKVADERIIDVLVRNGHARELAVAEVARAESDPYLMAGKDVQQRLDKSLSLLDSLHAVASLRPQAGIERRANVSRAEFLEEYYAANRPVILQGLMSQWRAMTCWTPTYLKETIGDEQVEIMAGRDADPDYELNVDKHRRTLKLSAYVDMVYSGKITNDYYLVANNTFFQRPAGHALRADIEVFTEYLDPAAAENQTFLWFGPAGTVTPLHHDTSNILMAQVAGRKCFKLIAATQWPSLYSDFGVFSRVDAGNPDFERWPRFRQARILDLVLEPGEVLFLPVGWWHHVRSLDVSIMVSFTNFVFPNRYEWFMPRIRR
jgi:LPS sulfotransferase NodH